MVKPYVGRVWAMLPLYMLYPDICFATEGKARKTRSQVS